MIFGVLNPEKI